MPEPDQIEIRLPSVSARVGYWACCIVLVLIGLYMVKLRGDLLAMNDLLVACNPADICQCGPSVNFSWPVSNLSG